MELHEFLDQKEQVENESFEIKNEQQANWALRKIKQYQEQKEKNTEIAVEEITKIEEWLKTVNDSAQDSIDYFQGLLGKYAMEQRESNPDFKSMKLPYGSMRFRKQQPAYKYDNKKVVESLKKSGRTDLIRVKEEPDKTAIKKAFVINEDKLINPETGEVVEGVEVEHRGEKFEVKTD